ncbi:Cytochrome c oxidase assembly protein cox19 [Aphanomyces cochlioides]|nr:Cytochrome c oxidase assembly protein cox19 [Aphanomyces cochlioides]
MNAFGGAASQAKPPEKGSFPLDHYGECKEPMKVFLACLKQKKNSHIECKHLSQKYLECRMDKGLMQQENLDLLGFNQEAFEKAKAKAAPREGVTEKEGFVSGLRVKGGILKEPGK